MSKQTTRGERRSRSSRDADHEAAGHRHERLSRILREEIAAVLRDDLADPRLEGVRITLVELSVDYKNARIGFVTPGAGATRPERERVERLLERATPFVRSRLAEGEFLRNGEIPMDNNACERALRRVVKGRRNWLSHGSADHAERACAISSLIASCEMHGIDPEFYLQEILTVAPSVMCRYSFTNLSFARARATMGSPSRR